MIIGYILYSLGLVPVIVGLTHILDPIIVFFMNLFGITY